MGRTFQETLRARGLPPLTAEGLDTLQVNVGKRCNQACKHCHVDAGPARPEMMTAETADLVVAVIRRFHFGVVDITGGAPELNPEFPRLVAAAVASGARVIDRCNLTVFFEPGMEGLPEFLKSHGVEVVASLPYFTGEMVDRQRGLGVFDKSVEALRRLNAIGYGAEGTGLVLNLVYNPVGAYLPPPQASMEADYRRELDRRFGVRFNRLYTLVNMPISRFAGFLERSGNFESYMTKLEHAFNPEAAPRVMCRSLVSVGWDGTLYDCDFNQMLGMTVAPASSRHIRDFDPTLLEGRPIVTGRHCFGCTAGAGSSCGGAVV